MCVCIQGKTETERQRQREDITIWRFRKTSTYHYGSNEAQQGAYSINVCQLTLNRVSATDHEGLDTTGVVGYRAYSPSGHSTLVLASGDALGCAAWTSSLSLIPCCSMTFQITFLCCEYKPLRGRTSRLPSASLWSPTVPRALNKWGLSRSY